MNDIKKNEILKNYLLGNIEHKLEEKIDQELISDESFADTVIFAEDLLIEDYLEGVLSDAEKILFYKTF